MIRRAPPTLCRLAAILLAAMGTCGLACRPASADDVSATAPVLNPGDSFRFREGDRTYLVRDVGWADELFVSTVDYEDGRSYLDYYTADLNLVRSEEIGSPETFHYSPDSMKYRFPMRVGLTWHGSYETVVRMTSGFVTEQYETAIACEVRCLERVDVPAGEFETFRIECTRRHSNQVYEEIQRYWYAPEVGVSVAAETARHDMPGLIERIELIAVWRSERIPFDALPDDVDSTCDFELVAK